MNPKQILPVFFVFCALLSTVALAADKHRIANEGTIGDKWMLADGGTLATATYPPALALRGDDVCIALGYLIGKDGKTSDFAVLKQWNSESGAKEPVDDFWQAFAQAGADAVSQWRFKPRPDAGVVMPTFTVATLGFQGKQAMDPAQLRGHCKIVDLADLLEKLKADPFQRGGINKQLQEHEQQQQHQRDLDEIMRRANGG